MNNKCSLKFGPNVFRLLSGAAVLLPSRADANDKTVEGGGWGMVA